MLREIDLYGTSKKTALTEQMLVVCETPCSFSFIYSNQDVVISLLFCNLLKRLLILKLQTNDVILLAKLLIVTSDSMKNKSFI